MRRRAARIQDPKAIEPKFPPRQEGSAIYNNAIALAPPQDPASDSDVLDLAGYSQTLPENAEVPIEALSRGFCPGDSQTVSADRRT